MARIEQRRGAAMGTSCRLVVVGGRPGAADTALRHVGDLERRWSRFLPDSELSQLNAAGGAPVVVSELTFDLVAHLVRAWHDSAGRFDPSVHDALAALGYRRSWPAGPVGSLDAAQPAAGCTGVRLDRASRMVWLPAGLHLDPGGLGKGLAADLVAEELRARGAAGVMVDLGGDLRVSGDAPDGDTWRLAVEHPGAPHRSLAAVEVRDGAVATTSRRRRRWRTADGEPVHHVLDPRVGRPADVAWTSATALAGRAVDAEVAATVAFLDGGLGHAPRAVAALLAHRDGRTQVLGGRPELFDLSREAAA